MCYYLTVYYSFELFIILEGKTFLSIIELEFTYFLGEYMTVKQRAEKGAELKAYGACNCTLSVLKAFEDRLGLDENLLVKTAAGFAAGMGGLEGTCGAIVGAVIVAGFLTEGQGTPRISKSIVSKFNEKSGATICKDLKKITGGRPLCECPQCVYNAIESLGECLEV